MSEIGKFSGRLKDKPTDEVMDAVFDFNFVEKLSE